MTITTERLSIEALAKKDNNFIFDLLNTEAWIKYIGNRNIHSTADADAYIERINENPNTTYWTVFLNETKKAIGLVTLIKRDYLEHRDIGFAFLPAFWGKGYAYEAVNAVLKKLAEQDAMKKMFAITLPENTASINLLEKLGLKFEREIEQNNETLHLYSN